MRVRLLASFGGMLEQHDCPVFGRVIDVTEGLARALCADGRAEWPEEAPPDPVVSSQPEAAMTTGAPERAMKPRARKR